MAAAQKPHVRRVSGGREVGNRFGDRHPCGSLSQDIGNKKKRGVAHATPCAKKCGQAARPISTSWLKELPPLHPWPINLVISKGSSDRAPNRRNGPKPRWGYLILRGASRLDAFSAYPFRTWLPSNAPGGTTGTLEVRPSRSSRTRDRSSQVSCAHGR